MKTRKRTYWDEPLLIRKNGRLKKYASRGAGSIESPEDFREFLPRYSKHNKNNPFKKIAEGFLFPLFNSSSMAHLTLLEKIELVFGLQYRDIVTCVATANFSMPGKIIREGIVFAEPTKNEKRVSIGTSLLIRIDDRMPDRIDAELLDKGLVFHLTYYEYKEEVLPFIKELRGCNERLIPPGDKVSDYTP